jgi:hypothetical protein
MKLGTFHVCFALIIPARSFDFGKRAVETLVRGRGSGAAFMHEGTLAEC